MGFGKTDRIENTNVKIMHLAWILEMQNKCKNNTSCQNMGPWAMGLMGPMGPMSPGPKGSWLGRGSLWGVGGLGRGSLGGLELPLGPGPMRPMGPIG